MNSLPSSVNYGEAIPSLPENATRYSVALQPTNGSVFGASSQITFQYPNRGYLIPDSVYLRYKIGFSAAGGAVASTIYGTPFFTPFQRLETQFGSVTVDSINNYHQVCNILTNSTMDWAQKYGNQFNYGYGVAATNPPVSTVEEMDSRTIAVPDGTTLNLSLAGPLPCLLTNINDKLLPLFAMPSITQILTLDSLSNMLSSVANLSKMEISNCELCFDFIELGSEVDAMVRAMGPKLYIKSQSFSNASVTMPVGTNGSQSYIFNQRYASVKGALLAFSGGAVNKLFDSVDPTNNSGSISINISGVQYPQKPYSTLNNKGAMILELRKVMGSIYDKNNSLAINSVEFGALDTPTTAFIVQTFIAPAKFYVGFNLQKLHSNALLTGISTNNSNITVNIEQTIALAAQRQCNLILAYDALLEIDIASKQASCKV